MSERATRQRGDDRAVCPGVCGRRGGLLPPGAVRTRSPRWGFERRRRTELAWRGGSENTSQLRDRRLSPYLGPFHSAFSLLLLHLLPLLQKKKEEKKADMRQVGERADAWGTSLRQGRAGSPGAAGVGAGRVLRFPRRTWLEASPRRLIAAGGKTVPTAPGGTLRGCGAAAGSVCGVRQSWRRHRWDPAPACAARMKDLREAQRGEDVTASSLRSGLSREKAKGLRRGENLGGSLPGSQRLPTQGAQRRRRSQKASGTRLCPQRQALALWLGPGGSSR